MNRKERSTVRNCAVTIREGVLPSIQVGIRSGVGLSSDGLRGISEKLEIVANRLAEAVAEDIKRGSESKSS